MNTKRVIVRLFVAIVGLLASVFELAGTAVRLATACLERVARCVQEPVAAPVPVALATAPAVPAKARVAPQATVAMTGDERLTSALLSLKFPAAKVRAFAISVHDREAPLEVLVKEGIVALSVN